MHSFIMDSENLPFTKFMTFFYVVIAIFGKKKVAGE